MALVSTDTPRICGRDTKSPVFLIEGERTNLAGNSEAVSFTDYYNRFDNTFVSTGGAFAAGHSIYTHTDVTNLYRTYRNLGNDTGNPETATVSGRVAVQGTDTSIGKDVIFRFRFTAYDANTITGATESWRSAGVQATLNYGWQILTIGEGVQWSNPPSNVIGINRIDLEYELSNAATAWATNDVMNLSGLHVEFKPFLSSHIITDSPSPVTRAADTYTLDKLPFRSGPKTLNVAGYFDSTRPAGSKHYWWTHAGSSWIRQDGDKLEVSIENLPLHHTIPVSGWVPVTLKDFGTYTEVWVDESHVGTINASIDYHTSELYTPTNTEEYAFTYLAFGASELYIPFLKPYEVMPGTVQYHQQWKTELEKVGVAYGA